MQDVEESAENVVTEPDMLALYKRLRAHDPAAATEVVATGETGPPPPLGLGTGAYGMVQGSGSGPLFGT